MHDIVRQILVGLMDMRRRRKERWRVTAKAVHSTDAPTTAPEGEQDPIEAILAEVERVELRRLVRDGFARPTVGNEGEEEPKDDLSEKDSTDLEEDDSSDGEEETGLAGVGEMDERGPIN
ncbi:hypothetical protein BT69DRAFT_1298258 [Atractiella rhizophila]|nr:hypothetical protein BT69DRAFT_1298258 [Atractiella rhizophila]